MEPCFYLACQTFPKEGTGASLNFLSYCNKNKLQRITWQNTLDSRQVIGTKTDYQMNLSSRNLNL